MLHFIEVMLDSVAVDTAVLQDFAIERAGIGAEEIDKLLVDGRLFFVDKMRQQRLPLGWVMLHGQHLITDLREMLQ